MPFLAGLDEFFNLLTNWTTCVNPLALRARSGGVACGHCLDLVTMGTFLAIAVRDILLARAAFTLARRTEVGQATKANS